MIEKRNLYEGPLIADIDIQLRTRLEDPHNPNALSCLYQDGRTAVYAHLFGAALVTHQTDDRLTITAGGEHLAVAALEGKLTSILPSNGKK